VGRAGARVWVIVICDRGERSFAGGYAAHGASLASEEWLLCDARALRCGRLVASGPQRYRWNVVARVTRCMAAKLSEAPLLLPLGSARTFRGLAHCHANRRGRGRAFGAAPPGPTLFGVALPHL
jgi:hypothetical protein